MRALANRHPRSSGVICKPPGVIAMNARETAVVRGFIGLTSKEKIRVYLEIEEVWKALQAAPISAPKPTPSSR
jgi:hypothetical protein